MITIPLDDSQWGRDFYNTIKESIKNIKGAGMSCSIIEVLESCCKKETETK